MGFLDELGMTGDTLPRWADAVDGSGFVFADEERAVVADGDAGGAAGARAVGGLTSAEEFAPLDVGIVPVDALRGTRSVEGDECDTRGDRRLMPRAVQRDERAAAIGRRERELAPPIGGAQTGPARPVGGRGKGAAPPTPLRTPGPLRRSAA